MSELEYDSGRNNHTSLGEKLEMFGSVVALGGMAVWGVESVANSYIHMPTIIEIPLKIGVLAASGGGAAIIVGVIHDMVTGRSFH